MATATMVPLATQTLGSAAASITFSSIPGTYTDLRLVLTGTTSAGDYLTLQFNGDTGTNYSATGLEGTGTVAQSGSSTSASSITPQNATQTSTTVPVTLTGDFSSYAGGTNKSSLFAFSGDTNGAGSVRLTVGLWRSTSAITSIKIFLTGASNFSTGTIATLWGI